ncbi:MAG: SAM-dependent chlorinase/fluorinase [Limisphaerales bacterium]
MKGSPIITLLTDFGTRDWFVGTMKGVINAAALSESFYRLRLLPP